MFWRTQNIYIPGTLLHTPNFHRRIQPHHPTNQRYRPLQNINTKETEPPETEHEYHRIFAAIEQVAAAAAAVDLELEICQSLVYRRIHHRLKMLNIFLQTGKKMISTFDKKKKLTFVMISVSHGMRK